jgi:probable O-glycosylation ligase (exosortase A-associated)
MRDVIVMSIVLTLAVVALRRPWIGVLLWLWVSLMNPHRYTYGFAYDAPVAMIAALATLLGFLFTREKESPFKSPAVVLFVVFTVWVTISWLMGIDPAGQFQQWDKVMKVNLMVVVCLMLFRTKEQIFCLAWVLTLAVALLSAKGGLFTLAHGGSYRVWGPPGSWIEGNNEFAVATIMTIPLLRFLQLQVSNRWLSRGLLLCMLLCAASALGSHSRGALLAIIAMATVLWWRGQNRFRNGVFFLVLGLLAVAAMPENWTQRMDTIETYDEDASALGRFSAWWVSWNLMWDYPFGVGFSIVEPQFFLDYSPYGMRFGALVAHSIWFQVMGHHGLIGILIWGALWLSTWLTAARLRRVGRTEPELKWVGDLGAMTQVCLVGYWAGGAFLQLAYYDFPYYVMALVALTHCWVRKKMWSQEPQTATGWRAVIGLAPRASPVTPGARPETGPNMGVPANRPTARRPS